MLNKDVTSKPAASWGKVAVEAVKHPWQSGIATLSIGTADIGIGAVAHDPILFTGGVGLDVLGAMRFNRFKKGLRYPTNSLH